MIENPKDSVFGGPKMMIPQLVFGGCFHILGFEISIAGWWLW